MKRILINKSLADEMRVALVEGAKLYDLDSEFDNKTLLKGSVFKAKVSRVETSLDAAFVNFGSEKHGFLPLKELIDDYFRSDGDKRVCTLKENDEIIVQVLKEERGTKGAALSTQISLAGRFLVLIPNSSKAGGVSRRISGDERDQIKNSIKSLKIPENMSIIVRTAGLGRSPAELQWDLDYLLSLWSDIKKNIGSSECPALIYKDDKLILKVFRDYFREDIGEILIDDKNIFDEAINFANAVIPDHSDKVKLYEEEIPLFNRYQIESQIESAFQREIKLPSGGSIVIDPTEAMVTIDVNSSRSTKGKDIEETALETNLEASREIARQLRLRDLGGLIVIDFIDMQDSGNQSKVANAMRKSVDGDRARIQIGDISRFGLLELSRQRLKPSLNETYDIEHVLVRGTRSLGQSILRIVGEDAAKDNTAEVHAYVPADVASYLLNEKRGDISTIENLFNVSVIVVADPYKSRPYYKVVRVKESEVKKKSSYEMIPDSPEPDLTWKNNDNRHNHNRPLVEATPPPKKPKGGSNGILGALSKIFSSSKNNTSPPKKRHRPKSKSSYSHKNKSKNFKPRNNKNKGRYQKSKKTTRNKPKNEKRVSNKKNIQKNKVTKPKKENKIKDSKNDTNESKNTSKPTRALNDPRYKSE
tara:strand:+ start:903 stop:2840 length:1938 start_codon:yes stop_codon:yes gene_type:complete